MTIKTAIKNIMATQNSNKIEENELDDGLLIILFINNKIGMDTINEMIFNIPINHLLLCLMFGSM
ncbi:hypothetical protein A2837_02855 [Candidatus Kaiserbacteria bacterium RIFCSPHIGHO2_01_FULL_46_22]|uniref:Uncharacterized protein n=1 Tax=Candidatus Kaiserbacteria bacterium RIFCSPHIGHO2_01_FULL_46_22 TaxID=1798475 RepID=A0A1F6BY39_9BACT|nr:MAG: hypothetical protein A2837_02855 [Candidatus Kaiserbacteria bacterium RIFCSPHIGHO2_01_FULL_46_22]